MLNAPRSIDPETQTQARGRGGNAPTCASCGQALSPKRGSRRQRYCNDACRKRAARAEKWADRYKTPDPSGSVENNGVASTACRAGVGDRAPLEILGHGHRWGAARPDIAATIHSIVISELGRALGPLGQVLDLITASEQP
jgi:hypothetical protein